VLSIVPKRSTRVSQESLRSAVGTRNHIRETKELLDNELEQLMELVLAGAEIEDGVHTVTLKTKCRGGKKVVKLVLN
jgi:hypothetical protein